MSDQIGIPVEDGFCCLSADWRFTFLNRITLELLKRKPEELTGKNVWEEYPSLVGTSFEKVCRNVMEKHFAQRIEMQSVLTDRWFHIVVFPSQGGVAVYWREITAEKQARDQLEELVAMLQQADENRNSFINILSHELRNPLAAITIGLTLLKNAEPGSGQADKAIGIMERQTKQLSRLVDDLLDVTRIAQNKIDLQKERIDLNEIVSHSITDFHPQFTDKGIELDFKRDPNPVWVDADPARITQAVGNLLHNAAKFSNKGDSVWIVVKTDGEKEQAVVSVQDTGYGIDPAIVLHLFEPFVQADSSLAHSFGGLGLGLPIVKGITELHGGCVSVVSDGVGKGARFTIRLPLSTGQPLPELSDAGAGEKASSPLNILIIEDIPDLAEILSDLLTHLGHKVTTALNGAEGISMARHHHPDVLISDIGLPGMNGYEIAEAFRSDAQLKDIYLIALSGYAQPEDFERSKKAGFRLHLAKPVSLESLKQALGEAGKSNL